MTDETVIRTSNELSYIQEVPNHCDRIIWRGRYYHLENMHPADEIESLRAAIRVKDKDYQALRAAYDSRSHETSEQPVAQRQWIEGSDDSNPGWYDYDEVDLSTSLRAGYEPLYAHPHTPKACEQCPIEYMGVSGATVRCKLPEGHRGCHDFFPQSEPV